MLRQLKRLFRRIPKLCAKNRIIGFILCAILLNLAFPTWDIAYFAWCAFVPFFLSLKNTTKLQAFLFSYLTGIVFWLGVIYWVAHVTAVGMVILVCYLALYFAVFGLIASFALRKGLFFCLFFIPGLWVVLEYARSHVFSGFPWALLAYTQYKNIFLIQYTDITGAWGVSFLIMLVNIALYAVFEPQLPSGKKIKVFSFILLLLCIVFLYGFSKVKACNATVKSPAQEVAITLIQGNIPQELKWDARSEVFILNKYFRLTDQAAKGQPDLLIWPEAAVPFILGEEPRYLEYLEAYARMLDIPLLVGAVTTRDGNYYNSALLMQSDGSGPEQYDKLHLVPFGEYVPLRKILVFLNTIVPIGDFKSGDRYTVFRLLPRRKVMPVCFSVLICFEDLFPQLSREFVKRGADFLVNITNDGWFQKTCAPYQHLQASVFRAVENQVYVVRAANTGISGFIDTCGQIRSLIHDARGERTFVDGYGRNTIPVTRRKGTFYTQHGDFAVLICFILVSFGVFAYFKEKNT